VPIPLPLWHLCRSAIAGHPPAFMQLVPPISAIGPHLPAIMLTCPFFLKINLLIYK
jgi:hypothetical protein